MDPPPNGRQTVPETLVHSNSSKRKESTPSRYESQKRRDWNTFGQYLKNHRPPLALSRCSGAHVLEFLRYLDQFGKTKVHNPICPFFGHPMPPAPCPCPLRQAWGSLDALVGRLRAAFEENGGHPEANPFGARAVRLYLREVREHQAKARGIAYEKKRRRPTANNQSHQQLLKSSSSSSSSSSTMSPPLMQLTQRNQARVFHHDILVGAPVGGGDGSSGMVAANGSNGGMNINMIFPCQC